VPDLRGIDLNLLVPLDALLRERHVSRAAERVAMSQPAMSRALRTLRAAFDDELLVRGPGGYRLTPRAERLQRDVAAVLPRLENLLSEATFNPQDAAHTFVLSGTDYILSLLGEDLLANVRTGSPRSTLHFEAWHAGVFNDLHRSKIDVAFTVGAAQAPLRTETLFQDPYVCVLAPEHPLASRARLTLDDYLTAVHVVVDIADGRQGIVDHRLDSLGRPRRVGATVPFHALAASVAARTDMVATLPRRVTERLVPDDVAVVTRPVPPEIGSMTFAMTWHPRLDGDPAQSWLRDQIRAVARSIDARRPQARRSSRARRRPQR
jgi:DNA-binding transcriptional LysR family regulator